MMNQALQTAVSPGGSFESLRFDYIKRPGLLKLAIVNFLLGLVTLGIYRFWAKTNVRKHIWSSVHLNGEPLEYTGTGLELFKGFLMVLLLIGLPIALFTATVLLIQGPDSFLLNLIEPAFILFLYVFMGYAIYKARKYQLQRTNWRGIRGTLAGSALTYSFTYFGALIAKLLSLGWATPVMNTILQEQIVSDMRFGEATFKFKGKSSRLYPTYAMCWMLSAVALAFGSYTLASWVSENLWSAFNVFFDPTHTHEQSTYQAFGKLMLALGVAFLVYLIVIPMLWAIYSAKELQTFASYTRFDGSQFSLKIAAGSLIWLVVSNFLIILFTLGIAAPFVQQRLVKFVIDRLALHGNVDIGRISQSKMALGSRGEGLADAFDVSAF